MTNKFNKLHIILISITLFVISASTAFAGNASQSRTLEKIQIYLKKSQYIGASISNPTCDSQLHLTQQIDFESNPTNSLYANDIQLKNNFITKFKEGYCCGISSLWLYTKWQQAQSEASNEPKTHYNGRWFTSTTKLIAAWRGDPSTLTPEESLDFERFILLIEYFQHTFNYFHQFNQGRLDLILNDQAPQKEYSISASFTLKQLKQLLKKPGIIQNNKMILISSHDHATALFKNGKNYYYFDPNSSQGEIKFTATDKIAKQIFDACSFDSDKPSPLSIIMFSFDPTSTEPYPNQAEILKSIGASSKQKSGYAYDISGIHLATTYGDLESLRYFLEKGDDPNVKSVFEQTPLTCAIYGNNIEIVKLLLTKQEVDPNVKDNDGRTPLEYAIQKDRHEIIKILKNDPRVTWTPKAQGAKS